MTKNTQNDQIDLIEILRVIIKRKIYFLIVIILGFISGILLSFVVEQKYETYVKFSILNPFISTSDIYETSYFENINNDGVLNKDKYPVITINFKNQTIKIISKSKDVTNLTEEIIANGIDSFNNKLNGIRMSLENNDSAFNNDSGLSEKFTYLKNLVYLNIDLDSIKLNTKITYSKTKEIFPNQLMKGLLGSLLFFFTYFLYLFVYKPIKNDL